MTDKANREGLKNWGHGPPTGRPSSVGPHDVKADQTDPANKGLDPETDYHGQPGDNKGLGITDTPGSPVNIQPKR
jgi:hypothetical protein